MKRVVSVIVPLVSLATLLASGCAGVGSTPPPIIPQETRPILIDNATHVTLTVAPVPVVPDSVELIYFHTKNPCHCMSVVGDCIQYAVGTYFKDEVAAGKVKLTMIVSDDPANADIMKKYDAMPFVLFIRENRAGSGKIYPVSEIWEMTGDDNREKLVNYIRTTVTEILAGKGS